MSSPVPPPAPTRSRQEVAAVVALSVVLFLLALVFPALGTCSEPGHYVTWINTKDILLLGWLGPLMGAFGWFANLAFVICVVVLLRGRRPWVWLPIVQMALVLTVFIPVQLPAASESTAPLCKLGTGFWLWFCAQGLIALASLAVRYGPLRTAPRA